MRIAPKAGYDFGNKRQYRRSVWKFFADNCPVPRAEAQCLLMPSLEGDEIEVALSKGFKEQNLHIVDMNPAIVATHKRTYPRINTYGVTLTKAIQRIPRRTIHVANVDLCSNLCAVWCDTCFRVASSLAPEGVIAATYLKGRDHGITQAKDLGWTRMEVASRSLGMFSLDDRLISLGNSGEYRSHNVPMAWIVGRSYSALPVFKFDKAFIAAKKMIQEVECKCSVEKLRRLDPTFLTEAYSQLEGLLNTWIRDYQLSLMTCANYLDMMLAMMGHYHGWSESAKRSVAAVDRKDNQTYAWFQKAAKAYLGRSDRKDLWPSLHDCFLRLKGARDERELFEMALVYAAEQRELEIGA